MNSSLEAPVAPLKLVQSGWADYAGLASRWALGLLFVYLGCAKGMDPGSFLKQLRQYELTSSAYVLNTVAAALPWFEVFCGLLLLLGVAVRSAALLVLGMLIPFTGLVFHRALGVAHAQQIALCAVRFDCGCGTGEVLICRKIVENILLMGMAVLPLAGWGRRWALRFGLFRS